MKTRFSTVDIAVVTKELTSLYGMRVVNVYDVDHKTYLIRLGKPDDKKVILIESGTRIHNTEFDWPKNAAPSGFSMKLRKHVKGRRLEYAQQLGVDRIVDLQFGSGEAAYHVIVELYDRGNIVLTDHEFTILNILRPRTDTCQDVRFAVRETYPISAAREHTVPTVERLTEILLGAQTGDLLKKVLLPHLDYGPAVTEHCLISAGFPENAKIGKGFNISDDIAKLQSAMEEAETLFKKLILDPGEGIIIQKKEKRAAVKDRDAEDIITYEEFHPMLFCQFEKKSYTSYPSFNKAVDEFFSKLESQKLDMKVVQQEKSALKKLDNIKKDHEKRIDGLQKVQETDISKGRLIELNLSLVDQAILIVRSAIANQIDWVEIQNLVKEAQLQGDPVACSIKSLKLDSNSITLLLRDPYSYSDDDFSDEDDDDKLQPMKIDIDLSLSAYANSRKYFEKKKQAAKKEQKTIDASAKALKSAEKKTKETLKDVATAASINKARKTYWFEKFLWFITSENYLVIGGRDQQQNELIVKRYLRAGDLYVHADLHGASSCVLKNPTGEPVPPKSLNEAGTMAICNSVAWDAKVVTSAWWVYHDQVSKTAPSGEYLTTGSFMIRGKKNYLPPSHLVYGFGILFKLEEGSVDRHKGERKVFSTEDDTASIVDSIATESDITVDTNSLASDSGDDESDNQGDKNGNEEDENESERKDESDLEDTKDDDENQGGSKNIVNSDQSDDEETCFPDTAINLQHVKGDKQQLKFQEVYELQRNISTTSSVDTTEIKIEQNEHSEQNERKPVRLSAKQRREMRKAKKNQQNVIHDEDEEDRVSWLKQETEKPNVTENNESVNVGYTSPLTESLKQQQQQQQQQQLKRGQRSKAKKMKEKYADQDEEERQLRMDILASGGAKKEDKKKKGKKGKETRPPSGKPVSQKQQLQQQKAKGDKSGIDVLIQPTAQIVIEDVHGNSTQQVEKKEDQPKKESKEPESDDEKQEEELKTDDTQMLESLTGIPVAEDELLFAIPVCAPYNALNNYKYKVKLLPGSTKRGKGAKTAINMFQHERTTTAREKDLLRILKDADTSRNIPGKVKVAAPNLHRKKGK